MLVLSGHGGGTSDDFLLKDENAQDALSMAELQEALTIALPQTGTRSGNTDRVFDILGFDACFMSMGEVALQIRAFADILVGAEGLGAGVRLAVCAADRASQGKGTERHPASDTRRPRP